MNDRFLEELRQTVESSGIYENEPMKQHTTFRVGGPADLLVSPGLKQLPKIIELCRKFDVPYYVIGNGSNLLVGDKGIRGLVIQMTDKTGEIFCRNCRIEAGAGVLLSQAANRAAKECLTGMEFAAGIPGSLGGAIVMNAGAYGREMKDIVSKVTVLDSDGTEKELSADELEFGYRQSSIVRHHYIITKAELQLEPGKEADICGRMKELHEMRTAKQPLEYPSAGSTFKRPQGYFAGKLIMDAGLRGYQVGGAQISEKHCGFVINKGGAAAADIVKLMQDVSEKVKNQFGVVLEPEVKMIGEF